MSVIELKISVDANNVGVVAEFLNRIANAEAKNIKVKDAEVVSPKVEEPKTAPAKKTTAKKPEPVKVVEPEEEEETFEEEEETFEEEEEITLDDLKALQATKVVEHKAAIIAKFKKYGAARLSDVDPKHYADYEKFLKGLK